MALDVHPGQALRWKLRYSVRPKCHPLLLDNNLNSRGTVLLNVYQLFLLTAYKFHTYAKELPKGECSLFSLIVVMMMMMMMMIIVITIPFYTLSSIHSAKASGAEPKTSTSQKVRTRIQCGNNPASRNHASWKAPGRFHFYGSCCNRTSNKWKSWQS